MDDNETRKLQQKESVYRKLYSTILQQNQGVLQNSSDNLHGVFDDEQQTLNRIFYSEVKNMLLGVGVTAISLASLRMGSRHALSSVFGEKKAKALKVAEFHAKQAGTEGIQNRIGTITQHWKSIL
jgi:hypothetical protein